MGISKIGSLFAANVDPVPAATPSASVSPQNSSAQGAPQVSTEAVVLSSNLQSAGQAPLMSAEAAQAAKVQKLKEEVRRGEYKPDSKKVAVTILRDIA